VISRYDSDTGQAGNIARNFFATGLFALFSPRNEVIVCERCGKVFGRSIYRATLEQDLLRAVQSGEVRALR
jgi:hypothetical protein